MTRPPPPSTPFPYTTLFRSRGDRMPDPLPPRWAVSARVTHHRRAADQDRQVSSRANLRIDRKSTRLNSSHPSISYAVFCLKKKKTTVTIKNTIDEDVN